MIRSRFISTGLLFAMTFLCVTPGFAQERADLEGRITSLMKKLRAREAEFFAPSEADKAAFANELRHLDTGLLRLMPREKYDGKLLTRGGGAYYSFTRLAHEYNYGSDIELQQNRFSVGFAGYDHGFLLNLGDVPFDAVNLEHPGVEFLGNYTPPTLEPEIRAGQRASGQGVQANGFFYRSYLDAKTANTYVLRSICYRTSDVLVAFRVIRQDTDGSYILLWKILKKFPVPQATN